MNDRYTKRPEVQRSIELPDSSKLTWCPKCQCPVAYRPGYMEMALYQHDRRIHR